VLYGAFAAGPAVDNLPGGAGLGEALGQAYVAASSGWGGGRTLAIFAPSVADSEHRRRSWGAFERASMSPAMARALIEWEQSLDVRAALPAVSAPTLVLHRVGDRATPIEGGRYVADHIPGATFVELPGEDHAHVTGDVDVIVDSVKEFLADLGDEEPRRALATVLVVEPVDGAEAGVAARLAASGGRVVAEARDCRHVVALFDAPARTIRTAVDLLAQGQARRAGMHVGECEIGAAAGEGVAVAVALNVAASARAGELAATQTVRDLVLGSRTAFTRTGTCQIDDVPDGLAVYSVG